MVRGGVRQRLKELSAYFDLSIYTVVFGIVCEDRMGLVNMQKQLFMCWILIIHYLGTVSSPVMMCLKTPSANSPVTPSLPRRISDWFSLDMMILRSQWMIAFAFGKINRV